MKFAELFYSLLEVKQSHLCVGIDPAYEGMRLEQVISSSKNPAKDILSFSQDIISKTGGEAIAFKPNQQYILPLGFSELKELNRMIHEQDALSILDIKLSDIGSTNDACCFWSKKCGFDAITASPFPGNMRSLWESCKRQELGLFLLCLMSNPEAGTFMKSDIKGRYAYDVIASTIEKEGITGAVVGATIDENDMKCISSVLKKALVLIPGIGAQQGSTTILEKFGKRSIVNVSRDVIFSLDPKGRARYYKEKINRIVS
ncbi:MAG: orotidine-5'-phosphate decarboxylase [Candidatus Methanofastidiosia archaeon]